LNERLRSSRSRSSSSRTSLGPGFNYYLGGRRSRVVINTDVLPRPDRLPDYPSTRHISEIE